MIFSDNAHAYSEDKNKNEYETNNSLHANDPGGGGSSYYPGTNIRVKQEDIIHTNKSKSTFFAGHTAIVGSNFSIYHALPANEKAKDSLTNFFNRFSKGDKFTILRPKDSSLAQPARSFATGLYSSVEQYSFDYNLDNFSNNYCSKFV